MTEATKQHQVTKVVTLVTLKLQTQSHLKHQGIAAEILIPPPVKFKCGIKPFRADAGHLCGLHAGTREGVCDQPGEGPELLKAFSVPEISRYMFPEGSDSKVGRF